VSRRRWIVFTSLGLALFVAVAGFHALVDPARRLEAALVMTVLAPMGDRASVVNDTFFQLLPPDQVAFRAQLTPYCSAIIPVLALACIGFFILHGTWSRRLLAVSTAAALVLVCNVLRISGSLWAGYSLGGDALLLFHDWIGTFFALVYTLVGFFLMLFVLLPSATEKIPRAARVSDVL
jgi:exosortase/archaeosortase family protein